MSSLPRLSLRRLLSFSASMLAPLPLGLAQGTIGEFPNVAFPPGNPSSAEKIELGRALFFEEQVSTDNTMACATCHLPEAGGADVNAGAREPGFDGMIGTPDDEFGSPGMTFQDGASDYAKHPIFGFGRQATARNAPTVIGAAFFTALFWDMRAGPVFQDGDGNIVLAQNAALESQAVDPPLSPVEMAHFDNDWDAVVAKLASSRPLALARDLPSALATFIGDAESYGPLFEKAFGTAEITRERFALAIATYERTLVPDQTPFDLGTMSPEQLAGFEVFTDPGLGLCTTCHPVHNRLFSDGQFHSAFLPDHFRIVKTPTLRNVGLRRRLMSSGQIADLDAAVTHYENIGFFFVPLPEEQRAQVIAFLGEGLTDPRVAQALPPFDRPTLNGELARPGSNLYGEGMAGSGGFEPLILAHSPPNLGNRDFKLGIGDGLGGARAVLLLSLAPAPAGATVAGAPLHVDRRKARVFVTSLAGDGAGAGVATIHAPLASAPELVGLELFAQWFVVDPETAGGLSASRAAAFVVF